MAASDYECNMHEVCYFQADAEDEGTIARSRGGKTARNRSEWGHSRVFSSDDEDDADLGSRARHSGAKSVASHKTKKVGLSLSSMIVSTKKFTSDKFASWASDKEALSLQALSL